KYQYRRSADAQGQSEERKNIPDSVPPAGSLPEGQQLENHGTPTAPSTEKSSEEDRSNDHRDQTVPTGCTCGSKEQQHKETFEIHIHFAEDSERQNAEAAGDQHKAASCLLVS